MIVMDYWLQVLLLALLFDILFGEPPQVIHPVVWMGKLIGLFVSRAPHSHRKMYGFFMVFFCVGIAIFAGLVIISLGRPGMVVSAFFLNPAFPSGCFWFPHSG